jgi:hypothetical protein
MAGIPEDALGFDPHTGTAPQRHKVGKFATATGHQSEWSLPEGFKMKELLRCYKW